ncbi:MAG: alpha/beta fold hydrolase [Saprospiraceae bacterium]|nr:alpha/beta fold hydrolase [Saprospiraceae bacterium]
MIILHGFLGCLDNWQSVAKSLSDQYQVFVPDLPNHGRSPHSNQFNFKILAEEISAFIRSHMDVPINAIGHSMGGKILLEIVNSQPEIFQKMVIADIGTKAIHLNNQQ